MVVEIHEMNDETIRKILSLPKKDLVLTFDDGLYTQYKYLDDLLSIHVPKYFFISTNIVCSRFTEQSKEYIHCADAHKKAFSGNKENYMTWSQIKTIEKMSNCFIGGHSHFHKKYPILSLIHI